LKDREKKKRGRVGGWGWEKKGPAEPGKTVPLREQTRREGWNWEEVHTEKPETQKCRADLGKGGTWGIGKRPTTVESGPCGGGVKGTLRKLGDGSEGGKGEEKGNTVEWVF